MNACTTTDGSDAVPAVRVSSQEADTVKLKAAVDELLGQEGVLLEANAFTESNWHSFQPKAIMGRDLRTPERLELWMGRDGCYLKRASTGDTVALTDVDCRAL